MSALEKHIKQEILKAGPMRVEKLMELAGAHYYGSRDPFGVGGDFTTAPEISQMFGEMIGVWVADTWIKMGSPAQLVLLECGPGRGTLMADLLRGTRHVPGLHDALNIHLLEGSPVLKEAQSRA